MAQEYIWKVSYSYHMGMLKGWKRKSQVFTNKIKALQFENQMRNDSHAKYVKLEKWFG